ncbi:MAG: hypothetical protein ACYCVZ_11135 [Streptosporangiaceae bacterium]
MDLWDASLGSSDAVWNCIESIARQGGFRGGEATLREVVDGRSVEDVTNRPWRWWTEACRLAEATGNDILAGRIFLFAYLFLSQMVGKMRAVDMMETGLGQPTDASYQEIAGYAVASLARLAPDVLIHDSGTGRVDVANALRMAEEVAGTTAPRRPQRAPD